MSRKNTTQKFNKVEEEEEIVDDNTDEPIALLLKSAFNRGFLASRQDFNGEVCSQRMAPESVVNNNPNCAQWLNSESVSRLRDETVKELMHMIEEAQ